jgi:1,4-dihydroxy-2-naphthoate octaprenyltransferase
MMMVMMLTLISMLMFLVMIQMFDDHDDDDHGDDIGSCLVCESSSTGQLIAIVCRIITAKKGRLVILTKR